MSDLPSTLTTAKVDCDVVRLLKALGRDGDERLTVCTDCGGNFQARIVTVADVASVIGPNGNTYYGTGVLAASVRSGRGSARDVVGVRELFADLDVKPGGMPSFDAARSVIDTLSTMMGARPGAIVGTGHGLQPHWALERDGSTDWPDANDRRWSDAVALFRRWGRLVAHVAERYGGGVDNVYDLARVLRVPGTMNTKTKPVPVTVDFEPSVTVSLDRLRDALDEYDVRELDDDRETLGEVVSAPSDWAYAAETCPYVAQMVDGWRGDTPTARHPWLVSQAIRLAAAHRLGCVSTGDYQGAVEGLRSRFAQLLTNEPKRKPAPGEVADAFAWGAQKVGTFTEERAGRELAAHEHDLLNGRTPTTARGNGNAPSTTQLRVTRASDIPIRRVRWLWDGRLPLGALSLLAGREGVGKSTVAYERAARVTRGELPGEYERVPKAVLVCATEDSWAHTIVPRLVAHGADLECVYRVEAIVLDNVTIPVSLPKDCNAVEQLAYDVDAALLLLDPLMSRVDSRIDTHKDAESRRALEPLSALLDRADMGGLGLIHHNKSGSKDPLDLVMASKAFTAVARAVHTVIVDPDDETGTRKLFGTVKNNLGRIDLPTLSFTIRSFVYDAADGWGETGRLLWGDDVEGTIADALARAHGADPEQRNAVEEAAEWLAEYMQAYGTELPSARIKTDGRKEGHSANSLKAAAKRLGLKVIRQGFPGRTYWATAQPVAPTSVGESSTEERE